jgi:hypothetical protein
MKVIKMINNLATVKEKSSSDFDYGRDSSRVIRGKMIKQVDGRNTCDDAPFDSKRQLLVAGVAKVAQRFHDDAPVESIFERPDGPRVHIDELNERVPRSEWPLGFTGEPRAPWQMNYAVYFIDVTDGSSYTMINGTVGMRIAFDDLCESTQTMRMLRGARVNPVVTIGSVLMKTKFGQKARPSFNIVEWRTLGGRNDTQPLLAHSSTDMDDDEDHWELDHASTVAPLTTAEIVNDEIPWN